MAIYHDSYLFEPEKFAADLAPFLEDLERAPDAYGRLRAQAIAAFDESDVVRRLADNYGGWDRATIVEELLAEDPEGPADVAFWLVLMLYNHLKIPPDHIGLRSDWRLMAEITKTLDWSDVETELLITGRSFRALFDFVELTEMQKELLDHLQPSSTAARAGWLHSTDVSALLESLQHDKPRFDELDVAQDAAANAVYAVALEMLQTAQDQGYGLCLIRSG
jgi:hypothetical protein